MQSENLNLNIITKDQLIALAVSGGPDSIAMLYMMHEQGMECVVVTVDHNLRPESKQEACYVAQICQDLGIEHQILLWEHDGINSNVHDQARDARYGLMTNWCKERGITTLCTAHHMDDRIEHFFIKVSRGAGLLGLIDHEEMIYNEIKIVRPMFGFTKLELTQYLENKGIKYFEDKSNSDPKYLRSNIRKWLDLMPAPLDPELFKKRVIGVKQNLARASKLVQRIFQEEMTKVIFENDTKLQAKATLLKIPEDEEIALMMLSHILPGISGEKDPPRMESMKRLYEKLVQNSTSKTTLCGCIIEKKKDKIMIYLEKK